MVNISLSWGQNKRKRKKWKGRRQQTFLEAESRGLVTIWVRALQEKEGSWTLRGDFNRNRKHWRRNLSKRENQEGTRGMLQLLEYSFSEFSHLDGYWAQRHFLHLPSSLPFIFQPPKVWLPSPPLYENYLATITYNLHVAKPPGRFSGLISLGIQQHLKQMTTSSSASWNTPGFNDTTLFWEFSSSLFSV